MANLGGARGGGDDRRDHDLSGVGSREDRRFLRVRMREAGGLVGFEKKREANSVRGRRGIGERFLTTDFSDFTDR